MGGLVAALPWMLVVMFWLLRRELLKLDERIAKLERAHLRRVLCGQDTVKVAQSEQAATDE